MDIGPGLRSAALVAAAECPESGVRQAASAHWFLANPEHEPDRAASGLREGLQAFELTPEADDWNYVDAEPLTDPDLCDRVAAAISAVRLERPADWMWGFFRVDTRILAVHHRSRVMVDGPGPQAVAYVLDPDVLAASGGDRGEAVVGRFEAKWWYARSR